MTEKFITFNTNDINFNDIGSELFKIAISLTFALNLNRKLAFVESGYTNIINIFIKYFKYKSLTSEEYENLNFKDYSVNNYSMNDNLIMIFNDDFSHKFISQEVRNLLNILIVNNSNYTNFINTKINNIMNFFNDYNIDNYVCINIKKDTFIPFYYEKTYYKHFNNFKLIILADDIEWIQTNFNSIPKNKIIYLHNTPDNRFINFVILSHFNNMIIDKNNFSWWCAFLGKKDKKIIIPDNNYKYYFDSWIM